MSEFPFGEQKKEATYAVVFPEEMCCNCATEKRLKIVETDVRNIRSLANAGTESVFIFYLPFCPLCEPSASRRTKTVFHRFLQLLLVFAIIASSLILAGTALGHPHLVSYVLPVSGGVAVITMWILMIRQRPAFGQSSYFQPVRVLKAERKFFSGQVVGMTLQLTNEKYRKRFCELNRNSIDDKVIQVVPHDD